MEEPVRPPCSFCGQPSSWWKVGHYWACSVCGTNIHIMQLDHILEHSRTPQYGGPVPTGRKSKFYD